MTTHTADPLGWGPEGIWGSMVQREESVGGGSPRPQQAAPGPPAPLSPERELTVQGGPCAPTSERSKRRSRETEEGGREAARERGVALASQRDEHERPHTLLGAGGRGADRTIGLGSSAGGDGKGRGAAA